MNQFLSQIIDFPMAENQYYKEVYNKRQIVIHHTVSNGNAQNVISSWQKTKEKVGVAFVIDREGKVYKAFSSAHWAYHLGTKEINNTILNKQSIGIELCSWGALTFKNGVYLNTSKEEIPKEEVITYISPFRGYRYYQKYTEKHLESLKSLVQYLCENYNIPKIYHPEMWGLSNTAIRGNKGIFTHVSYRKDKSDCHPQKELVDVLKSI